MKKAIRKAAVPALLLLTMATSAAWAQTTAPSSPAAPMSATSMPASSSSAAAAKRAAWRANRAQRRSDMVEQRLTTMHDQLQITDAQSSQWNAYAQTVRDNADKTQQAFKDRSGKLSTMHADEAMQSYADLAQMHADNMKKLASATSDLYAALSPEQKANADTLFRNQALKRRGGGHGKGKGGSGHMMHKSSTAPASTSSSGSTPSGG